MTAKRRVVVTGIGVATALGLDEHAFWERLAAGVSGVSRLGGSDQTDLRVAHASQIESPLLLEALEALGLAPTERAVDLALLVAAQALQNAGLLPAGPPPPQRIGAIFGTGHGPAHAIHDAWMDFTAKGPRGLRPTAVPRCMANAICAQVSMRFRLTGPNYAVVSACTSSTTAIGIGFRMIRDGYADAVLCGGAESPLDRGSLAAWSRLGVMSKNPDPARACRPFDRDRDGFVIGEGAAALLLEALDVARARGAACRGEIAGFGESSDAEHITRPSVAGQTQAIRAALADAAIQPERIGFVNAHGTATRANDECESLSLRQALGAAADAVPVSANKSFFGHLLGAAGAVETVAALLALERRTLPPNLNLDHPDPACPLRFAPAHATPCDAEYALKNSFAFGGNNGVLVLRRGPTESAP